MPSFLSFLKLMSRYIIILLKIYEGMQITAQIPKVFFSSTPNVVSVGFLRKVLPAGLCGCPTEAPIVGPRDCEVREAFQSHKKPF